MTEQPLIKLETVIIEGHQIDICKDGYGMYHAVSWSNPYFNISDHGANRNDIVGIATNAIHTWQRYVEERSFKR